MRISDWSSDVCSSDLKDAIDACIAIDKVELPVKWQLDNRGLLVARNKAKQPLTHALLHLEVETIGSWHQAEQGGIRVSKVDDRLLRLRKVDAVDRAFASQMGQVNAYVEDRNRHPARSWGASVTGGRTAP